MALHNIILGNKSKSFDLFTDSRATPFVVVTNKHAATHNIFVRELACVMKILGSSTMILGSSAKLLNPLTTKAESALELRAKDISLDIKMLLENLVANSVLSSKIDATTASKILSVLSSMTLDVNVNLSVKEIVDKLLSEFTLDANATTQLGYYYLLADIDGIDEKNTLVALDLNTLGDLEFTQYN